MEQKPPILYFAEFFFEKGFTQRECILACSVLEKGLPLSVAMEVGLGFKKLEEVMPPVVNPVEVPEQVNCCE
jgi:hypothetical protein